MNRWTRAHTLIALAAALIVVSASMAWLQWERDHHLVGWVPTTATVVSTEAWVTSPGPASLGVVRVDYHVTITASYEAGDRSITSTAPIEGMAAPPPISDDLGDTYRLDQDALDRDFPPGSAVSILYDPDDPAEFWFNPTGLVQEFTSLYPTAFLIALGGVALAMRARSRRSTD